MHLMTKATKSPATLSLKFFRKSHNNFELFLVVLVVLVVVFSSDVTTFEIILYDIPGNKVLPVCNKIIAHVWLLGPWWAGRYSEQPAVQRDGNKYKLYFLYEVNGSSCSSCRFFLFVFLVINILFSFRFVVGQSGCCCCCRGCLMHEFLLFWLHINQVQVAYLHAFLGSIVL